MVIKISENVDEKMLLIAIIGNLDSIRNNGITIDEAEKFLFSPYMISELTKKGCDTNIIEIIKEGCELEDIASLIPEKLNDIIDEMKQKSLMLLKNYEEIKEAFWIEL